MICKKCNGKGYIYTNAFGTKGILRCDVCGGNGKILSNQQTNEEWLHTLNTKELANFLNLIVRVGPYKNEPKDFWEHVYGRGGDRGEKSIVEWLKQPHKDTK